MGNSTARNGGVLSELDSVPEVRRLNDLLAVSEAEACGALAAWRDRSHRRDRNGGSMGHGLTHPRAQAPFRSAAAPGPPLRTGIHVLLAMPVREAGMTSVIFFLVVCAAGIAAAVAAIKVVGWFQVELREYRRDALQRDRRRSR
jgi:hypothetical protein